ncbi:hypothetical protein SAMN04488697_109222 [Pseudomonas sp. 43mfcvi1.1]|nr:hypothetical protein ATJ40_109222 [Pseudomonas sp. 43mfcvi1.1]SSB97863.1 hypothetical protein SAMN04488697_109222 [Pseudomonas sp. 43mfcvi1.1]
MPNFSKLEFLDSSIPTYAYVCDYNIYFIAPSISN